MADAFLLFPAEDCREALRVAADRSDGEKLFIDYEATTAGSGYVAPSVMLEFGARSTGEPASRHDVACGAAGLTDGVAFPTVRLRVMHAERTFWEKATTENTARANGAAHREGGG